MNKVIVWQRLDQPGHEYCELNFQNNCWNLSGTALFSNNQIPCKLDYLVICNSKWQTLSGKVSGWVGKEMVEIELSIDSAHRWKLNGKEYSETEGCIDLDLNFSPSTNLLPIRRLDLSIGEEAEVKAAWLRFPSFQLEPLNQLYRRIDKVTYRYESGGGKFVTELKVDDNGFVAYYPGIWKSA
jgi:uncharacterized protein